MNFIRLKKIFKLVSRFQENKDIFLIVIQYSRKKNVLKLNTNGNYVNIPFNGLTLS